MNIYSNIARGIYFHNLVYPYFKEFIEYLDISEVQFWEIVDSWRLDHIWSRDENDNWKLKTTIY